MTGVWLGTEVRRCRQEATAERGEGMRMMKLDVGGFLFYFS